MPYILYPLAFIIALVFFLSRFRTVIIFEYQRGLKYSNGRFVGVIGPGRYKIYIPTTVVQIIDIRPSFVTISGQEVLSSDGITLKVSLAAQYQIADPQLAINSSESYNNALYLILQMGIREIIGSSPIDDILEKRGEFGTLLAEKAASEIESLGIKLISVDLKDIMLPGEVKKLFNQIIKARKEGLAVLEKTRAETAALRNLANAAQMMEDHPILLQLRVLQQMSESTENTFVIGVPQNTPIVLPKASHDSRSSLE
ncbi:MAG: slipin family protein [Armatimonadota bacterium]